MTNSISFTDVNTSSYYYDAVRWGVNNGIVSGTSSTTFSPTNPVKRQDAATFLYRYAGVKGLDRTELADASDISDFDSVSGYAQTPVRWVVGIKVMDFFTYDGFYPATYLTRHVFAYILVQFGIRAEWFDVSRDSFLFRNSKDDFCVDEDEASTYRYEISASHMNQLTTILRAEFGDSSGAEITAVSDLLSSYWGGACYGMAVVCALDKVGKLDFNNNFDQSNYMSGVDCPKDNYIVESAIHYYQALQVVSGIHESEKTSSSFSNLEALAESVDENGLVILGMRLSLGGHAILLFDVEKVDANTYYFYAYDPNMPNEVTILIAEKDSVGRGSLDYYEYYYNAGVLLTQPRAVSAFACFDTLNVFDTYDLDGRDNCTGYVSSTSSNETVEVSMNGAETEVEFAEIYFEFDSAFELVNSSGQSLVYGNGEFSGDMPIHEMYFTMGGAGTSLRSIKVDASDKYSYYPDNAESYFAVKTVNDYIRIEEEGAESITVESDGTVLVEGSDIKYNICKHIGTEDIDYMVFDGTADSELSISVLDNSVSVKGAFCTTVENYAGSSMVSKQNFTENDVTGIFVIK